MELQERKRIQNFKPSIKGLDSATDAELSLFHAGDGFESFDDYIQRRNKKNVTAAQEDREDGKGVTHLIWNEEEKDIVGYFTIAVNVIPYDDGIEDDRFSLSNYPFISALEIKMFAVSEKYQDVFFEFNGKDMPIAAWCVRAIVGYAKVLCDFYTSFQALFLHSLPSAVKFYLSNGFSFIPTNAKPLYSDDQDCRAMWMPIKNVVLRQDENGDNQ